MSQKIILKAVFTLLLLKFSSVFAFTIEEAMKTVVEQGSQSRQIESEISKVKSKKFVSLEQTFLPSVYLGLDETKEENFHESKTSLNIAYSLSAIYKGGIGFYAGTKAINANVLKLEAEQRSLAISFAMLFLEVLEREKRVQVFEKSLELLEKSRQNTEQRVKLGYLKPSNLYLVEADLEEVHSLLELEKGRLENAKTKFFAKIGVEAKGLIEPKAITIPFKSQEELELATQKNSLNVKSAQSDRISSKYQLAYTYSQFLPDVSIGYSKYKNKNLLTSKEAEGSRIFLNARFYLYKPGLISEIFEQSYDYRSSKFALQNSLEEASTQAKELWVNYEYASKIMTAKEKSVSARALFFREKEEEYKNGRIEITEKLDAEKKLRDAELEFIKARFERLITIYKIKNLSGEELY
jgi:outer membrane protein TolC